MEDDTPSADAAPDDDTAPADGADDDDYEEDAPSFWRYEDPGVEAEIQALRSRQRRARRRALLRGAADRNSFIHADRKCDTLKGLAHPSSSSSSMAQGMYTPVEAHVHVYNLRGVGNANDTLQSLGLGGAYHIGIELFGVEWSYGWLASQNPSSGVYAVLPMRSPVGIYRESISLGHITTHSARDTWRLLSHIAGRWLGTEYHPFSHNCLHFCKDICRRLGIPEPPGWTHRLADVADTLLTPILEAFEVPVIPVPATPPDGFEFEPERKHLLSPVTQCALEFERRFSWSLAVMCLQERHTAVTAAAEKAREAAANTSCEHSSPHRDAPEDASKFL